MKYLTDNTPAEHCAMINAVQGLSTIPEVWSKNYSALADYFSDYDFGDAEISEYFRRYKQIKLSNFDDDAFKQKVQEMALRRPYNKFKTRQMILERAGDKIWTPSRN